MTRSSTRSFLPTPGDSGANRLRTTHAALAGGSSEGLEAPDTILQFLAHAYESTGTVRRAGSGRIVCVRFTNIMDTGTTDQQRGGIA